MLVTAKDICMELLEYNIVDSEGNERVYKEVTLDKFCDLIHAYKDTQVREGKIYSFYQHGVTIGDYEGNIKYYKRIISEEEIELNNVLLKTHNFVGPQGQLNPSGVM